MLRRSVLSLRVISSCQISRGHRALHTRTVTALEALSAFPEYVSSGRHRESGKLDQAVVDLQRVGDVLLSSVGAGNSITIACQIKLASLHVQRGDVTAAEKVLQLPPTGINKSTHNLLVALLCLSDLMLRNVDLHALPPRLLVCTDDIEGMLNAACVLQVQSTCKLLAGDLKAARKALSDCDALMERYGKAAGEPTYTSEEIMNFNLGLKVMDTHLMFPFASFI